MFHLWVHLSLTKFYSAPICTNEKNAVFLILSIFLSQIKNYTTSILNIINIA